MTDQIRIVVADDHPLLRQGVVLSLVEHGGFCVVAQAGSGPEAVAAVEAFLPNGGTPGTLEQDYTDPTMTSAGILASQILALTLNREYSCAGVFYDLGISPSTACYGSDIISEECGGPFAGLTVDEFLDIANKAVAGKINILNGFGASLSDVNYTATCLNSMCW